MRSVGAKVRPNSLQVEDFWRSIMKNWMKGFVLVASLAVSGCSISAPPEAAVLEGTWQAEFDEPGDLELVDVQFVFDANGALTQITATPPEGATITLNVSDATTSQVDGDQVTISVPIAGGTSIFEGTLSSDQNSIDGSLSKSIDFPSGNNIVLPGSDLTLTRVAE
jgi:hypothetical protein